METKDHGNGIIEFISDGIIVNEVKDWTELFLDFFVQRMAIIKKENLNDNFYDLKTGFAGELLQKISNYSKRLAIVGDFSQIKSKALRDFIYESNRTKQVIFVKTVEDALKIFGKEEE
jgi:phosphopentomutase